MQNISWNDRNSSCCTLSSLTQDVSHLPEKCCADPDLFEKVCCTLGILTFHGPSLLIIYNIFSLSIRIEWVSIVIKNISMKTMTITSSNSKLSYSIKHRWSNICNLLVEKKRLRRINALAVEETSGWMNFELGWLFHCTVHCLLSKSR